MIVIHIECDDEVFRTVVSELLAHQGDMRVLGVDDQVAEVEPDQVDVVVFGLSPLSDVALHASQYREAKSTGAVVVVFCTAAHQAAEFEDLGVEYLVDSDEPARDLAAAVRAAYRQRGGRSLH